MSLILDVSVDETKISIPQNFWHFCFLMGHLIPSEHDCNERANTSPPIRTPETHPKRLIKSLDYRRPNFYFHI